MSLAHLSAKPMETLMLIDTRHSRLLLDNTTLARLDSARGVRLRCVSGDVWITIDGDRRDILLSAGDSFVIDSQRHVIVCPLHGRATLDVCAGEAPPSPPQPAFWHRVAAKLSIASHRSVAAAA